MANHLIRNDLAATTISALAITAVRDAGCAIYIADKPWFAARADRGWCAAEIARAFVRANFHKDNPMRRKLLTALTKLGARQIAA